MLEEVRKVSVDSEEPRVSTLPESLTDEYKDRLGKLIKLTERQKSMLKAWLKDRLNEWESDTADLHQNLEYDNDLLEGVTYETDYPWVGASNVHVGMPQIYADIYMAIEKRSILGADLIWYAETDSDDPEINEQVADVDIMLNYKARNEWNIEKALKAVFWVTNRDGLGAMQIDWVESWKKMSDIILLANTDDFEKEFPTPEESGMTEEEWLELGIRVESEASDEAPVEVETTFEKKVYSGCKGEVIDLVNFVTIPASVPDIRDELCRGYGRRYPIRSGTVRKNIKDECYYKDEAESLLQQDGYQVKGFELAQDEIDGLRKTNTKGTFHVYELTIKGILNGLDGQGGGEDRYDEEMEFTVVYNKDHDKLLRCIEYPYRVCNVATFRIDSRPNRLRGRSIPDKTRDLSDEIDTQHNQRINARTITTIPTFKILKSKKGSIDGNLIENKFKPGRAFYVDNMEDIDQWKIQPTDMGESMAEEKNAQNILDLKLGAAASLLSGQAPSGDPDAPGNKTQMLISQSNLRMDSPLNELKDGVEQVGDICLSHTYQFGSPVITFRNTDEMGKLGETKTIFKKYLRRGIQMKMSGINVVLNPEIEMQKGMQVHQMLMTEPLYASNEQLRIQGLKTALRMGRVPGRNKLLPNIEQIKEIQVGVQMEAMKKMEAEKMMAQKQQEQEALDQRMAAAKKELDIKGTASRMAAANLPMLPEMEGQEPVGALNGN